MKYNKDKLFFIKGSSTLSFMFGRLWSKNSVDMQKYLRLVYVRGVMSLSFITSIYISLVLNKETEVKREQRLIA